eukprot:340746_1
MNAITGILLSLTIPLPSKILYDNCAYTVNTNDKIFDVISLKISPEWIISYTLWICCFVLDHTPKNILLTPLQLGPCFIKSFKYSYNLYFSTRLFCVVMVVWILTPTEYPALFPWCLNGEAFDYIINISNQKIIFEIWGAINLIIALIHTLKWIKWIRQHRKQS